MNITKRMREEIDLEHDLKVEGCKEIMLVPTHCSCNRCKTNINKTVTFNIANVTSNKIDRKQKFRIKIYKSCK